MSECPDFAVHRTQTLATTANNSSSKNERSGKTQKKQFQRRIYGRALCLSALFTRRQHARMPPLILGVGIAEPPPARCAVHSRRITARLIVRRHALTQALRVRALCFLFFHVHTSVAILHLLISNVFSVGWGTRLVRKERVLAHCQTSRQIVRIRIDESAGQPLLCRSSNC
jgi:hypothetical protein